MGTSKRGNSTAPAKKVWRISRNAPMGEWVVVKPTPEEPQRREELPEVYSGGWVISSYDLLSGSEVIEGPDTIPSDLFDELFLSGPDEPKDAKP
jgi:hypothetical protein